MCLETRPVSVRLSASAVHGQEWRNIETRDNIVTHSWHHAPQWGGGLSWHEACHSTQRRRISQKRPQWSQLRLQCYRGRSGWGFWRDVLYQLDINVEIWIWEIILYFIREVMRNRLKYCSKEWINCVTLPCTLELTQLLSALKSKILASGSWWGASRQWEYRNSIYLNWIQYPRLNSPEFKEIINVPPNYCEWRVINPRKQ